MIGTTGWQAESNIALVKYWGKHGNQLPNNPSISFTLNNAFTKTYIAYKDSNSLSISLKFEGKKNNLFENKIIKFINSISHQLPFLLNLNLEIESSNSFPHSSGIASSASSMCALCACIIDIGIKEGFLNKESQFQMVSSLARQASGSASRSAWEGFSLWGKTTSLPDSSNEYAVPINNLVDQNLFGLMDCVLIVDKGQKEVSSSVGHKLLESHPFAEIRYKTAHQNTSEMLTALKTGSIEALRKISEQEALMLHSLMLTSNPAFILMQPETVAIIKKIWEERNKNGTRLFFTLDAGANVHLIFHKNDKNEVMRFVDNQLIGYCQNDEYICNTIGQGPLKIN